MFGIPNEKFIENLSSVLNDENFNVYTHHVSASMLRALFSTKENEAKLYDGKNK
jgi:hypothetical protein